jgi:hypothetical protein
LEVNPSFIKAIASAIILGSEGSGGSGENNKTKNYYGWLVVIEIMIKKESVYHPGSIVISYNLTFSENQRIQYNS